MPKNSDGPGGGRERDRNKREGGYGQNEGRKGKPKKNACSSVFPSSGSGGG